MKELVDHSILEMANLQITQLSWGQFSNLSFLFFFIFKPYLTSNSTQQTCPSSPEDSLKKKWIAELHSPVSTHVTPTLSPAPTTITYFRPIGAARPYLRALARPVLPPPEPFLCNLCEVTAPPSRCITFQPSLMDPGPVDISSWPLSTYKQLKT